MPRPRSARGSRRRRLDQWFHVTQAWAPSVVHDGREVLCLSDASGLPQAWRVSTRGGPTRRLAVSPDRIGKVDACPTFPRAVLARDTGGNETWQLELHELGRSSKGRTSGVRLLTPNPEVMNLPGMWTDDGRSYLFASNARDHRFFDVYRLEVDGGAPAERIWTGDSWQTPLAARGEQVLVQRLNTFLNVDLFLVGSGTTLHLNPHTDEVSVSSAAFGPDGVYVGTNPGREFLALLRYPLDGSAAQVVREYPGDIEVIRSSPAGDRLALTVNRNGWSELHVVRTPSGADRRVEVPFKGVISEIHWLPDGSGFAYDLNWSNGHEIFLAELTSGRTRQLTRSAHQPPARVPEPRLFKVRTEDGLLLPCLEYSLGRGRPRGTLLWVHGGPEGQARPLFDPDAGFVLTEGWRVVMPNVRGSSGYGRTYLHLDDVRKRMDSVRDLRDIAHALVRSKKAPAGRLGIVGGSYGGFMVLSAITTYPDLWGAAVELFGIANLVTFLEKTADWRRPQREAEYGSLEHDREFLEAISPIHHLDRVRTPLLVLHGRNDPRVPFGEAEQIVRALREMGRTVEFVAYENEGHGFARRENQIETARRAAEFLDRYLDPTGKT